MTDQGIIRGAGALVFFATLFMTLKWMIHDHWAWGLIGLGLIVLEVALATWLEEAIRD
jgi:hypothetical protein